MNLDAGHPILSLLVVVLFLVTVGYYIFVGRKNEVNPIRARVDDPSVPDDENSDSKDV